MKSIAMLVAAGACSLVAAEATADGFDNRLKGQYAFTENQQCLFALGGFDSNLHPVNTARSALGSDALAGVYTFDGRGGLTVDQTFHGISTPAFTQTMNPALPYADSQTGSGSGYYKFEADGSVTLTFAITAANILNGPIAGLTFSIDQFVLSGRLSQDDKTLLLSAIDPVVSTATFSNGLVLRSSATFRGRQ